jgi:hypothetical protein
VIADFESRCERALDLQWRLREAWAYAREEWTDTVALEFEQAYWDELEIQLSKLLNAANDLLTAMRSSH